MHPKNDTLLLAYVFENFRKMCLEIYEFDPANFFSTPGLAWQAVFKKTNKIKLLTATDILSVVEKGIIGKICNAIHGYEKANNIWKIMVKINNNHVSIIGM